MPSSPRPPPRQRGIAVLADTGHQIEVSLRLPVLAETGIIEPGAFVEYGDGSVTRLGLVRSTQIEAGMPEVWQTLGVQGYAWHLYEQFRRLHPGPPSGGHRDRRRFRRGRRPALPGGGLIRRAAMRPSARRSSSAMTSSKASRQV